MTIKPMVLALVALVGGCAFAQVPVDNSRAILGGTFEASGVANVPGANGVLFVNDALADAVLWMALDASGVQQGDAVRVPLGVSVPDPEAMTFDGTYFYVASSQSTSALKKLEGGKAEKGKKDEKKSKKSGKSDEPEPAAAGIAGLVRFKFDAATRTASSVERVDGFGALLTAKIPELARLAQNGGINIEGLAWDPRNGRLLVGLRGPMAGTDALVVPVTFEGGNFSASGLRVADPGLIRLSLAGQAIRSIEYDSDAKVFLVVAGAPETSERTEFALWEWDGGEGLRERRTLHRDLKPEGVTRVAGHTLVVCDSSRYLLVD
jgi:hypothetical protein